MEPKGIKVMARNREAYHEYLVIEEFEAGREYVPTINVSTNASSVKFTLNLDYED